uniref:Uncharacterized protein n=1 Tax=Tanacetum cinerariifolium TaxID=118510 RepID=A0A699UET6_TANCI|nr:hypothetical protein [Tanacetum cinerariifolium]
MRVRGNASWVKGTSHMGMLGEAFGTVQVECRCTGWLWGRCTVLCRFGREKWVLGSWGLGLGQVWPLEFWKVATGFRD